MEQGICVSTRTGLLCLLLFVVFQVQTLRGQGGGGGGANRGTVSSITEAAGGGIDLTPNTITTTGSVGIAPNGVVNSMLANGIDPAKIAGTAAVLGANTFTATQTLNNGNLALPPTINGSNGVLTVGGEPFLHGFGTFSTYVGPGAGNFAMTAAAQGNTALGSTALAQNYSGHHNTAIGHEALYSNTGGYANAAVGRGALQFNTIGVGNTALGYQALSSNIEGLGNTAVGVDALQNSTGPNNIAIGAAAGFNLTGVGQYNIYIGNRGLAGDDFTIRVGDSFQTRTFVAGIRGVTTVNANAVPVLIDTAGQLGTASSSRRVKQDIRAMGESSDVIMALRPVRFRYKAHGPDSPEQYGLVAEEVAEVAPELVASNEDGAIETVFYDKVNAMLLNEVQKQHRQIEAQQERIRTLEGQLQQMAAATRQLQTQMAAFQAQGERGNELALVTVRH